MGQCLGVWNVPDIQKSIHYASESYEGLGSKDGYRIWKRGKRAVISLLLFIATIPFILHIALECLW